MLSGEMSRNKVLLFAVVLLLAIRFRAQIPVLGPLIAKVVG